ncbi:MAG: inosine/xanthosine triphosphatase [bacterium]|nr:inosine/xanthosine triphosphatase [bacterium]
MHIVIASKNPVKISATIIGFKQVFPGETFDVSSVLVPSGVSEQPMNEEETLFGALCRAKHASEHILEADFYIGLEGGCEDTSLGMKTFTWIVVRSRNGLIGKGKTGTFFLPQSIAELVRNGVELGKADDIVFGCTNSKQENGAIGLLTGDIITRTSLYSSAVILALIPFKNQHLFTIATTPDV